MSSTLTDNQDRVYRKDYVLARNSIAEIFVATARYDDRCGNGVKTFSLTGELYDSDRRRSEAWLLHINGKKRYLGSCGCLHTEIAHHFPELAPLIKWHLCSSDGPLHYIANTIYHARRPDFDSARLSAIWPAATDSDLGLVGLGSRLDTRLPALLADFRAAMESLGFVF